MTEGFEAYEEDFNVYYEECVIDIEAIDKSKDDEARSRAIEKATNTLGELERYYRILEGESRAGDAKQRRQMQQKLRQLQSKQRKCESNLQRAKLLAESKTRAKQQALNQSNDPKAKMVQYQQRLDKNGNYLQDAQKTIAETEQIGINIDNNLARQREQIEGARQNVQNTRENTKEAGGHLKSLGRKTFTNIICLWIVILLLLAAIGISIWWKLKDPKPNNASSTPSSTPSQRI